MVRRVNYLSLPVIGPSPDPTQCFSIGSYSTVAERLLVRNTQSPSIAKRFHYFLWLLSLGEPSSCIPLAIVLSSRFPHLLALLVTAMSPDKFRL